MGQSSSFAVPAFAAAAASPESTPPVSAEVRETTRQVTAALQSLNAANFAGEGREITFSVDRQTRLPVVRVIDTQSKEVIQQWPREYVLAIAQAQLQQQGSKR